MTGKLNIGIVGTGGMGKIHAAAYMKNEHAAVRGVCSVTLPRSPSMPLSVPGSRRSSSTTSGRSWCGSQTE